MPRQNNLDYLPKISSKSKDQQEGFLKNNREKILQ